MVQRMAAVGLGLAVPPAAPLPSPLMHSAAQSPIARLLARRSPTPARDPQSQHSISGVQVRHITAGFDDYMQYQLPYAELYANGFHVRHIKRMYELTVSQSVRGKLGERERRGRQVCVCV
jgi:hypothetical protein